MGVKELLKNIRKVSPDAVTSCNKQDFSGTVLAIDMAMFVYSALSSSDYVDGLPEKEQEELEVVAILQRLQEMFQELLELGIDWIAVFDGLPSPCKRPAHDNRSKTRTRQKELLQKDEDMYEKAKQEEQSSMQELDGMLIPDTESVIRSQEARSKLMRRRKNMRYPKPVHIRAAKAYARKAGEVIIAPHDGEQFCSFLNRIGMVDAVLTEDMDCVPFLAKRMIVKWNDPEKMALVNIPKAIQAFDMPLSTFRDYCILCGCDFGYKVDGVGPKKAYDLMKKYGSIEALLEAVVKVQEGKLDKREVKGIKPSAENMRKVLEWLPGARLTFGLFDDLETQGRNLDHLWEFAWDKTGCSRPK